MSASFVRSAVRSIRATPEEWDRWRSVAVAKGFTLNRWARKVLGQECDRVEAEVRRVEASKSQRDELLRLKRGEF